ncbi:MAG: hypothetical protein JW723_15590 [Bacteroidales bacterium]|nr:hypothetical protein [Bacteroidales bacterium]
MNKLFRHHGDKTVIDYLVILVVLVIGMWQLFFCQAVMKWDMTDINLPWNHFISECINHGRLPLWNPYSRFGFPQYGDPGTWYPVNWLIGLFRQYDLYAIHFEYLLHLFLAATGMYKLGKFFGFSRHTRLIAAVSYMLSGFFIGNAQHIWWLINATWLPFAFLYLLRLHKNPVFTDALKLGFVFFLMLAGGYPGLFIPTVYLFFVTFIILIIQYLKNREYAKIRRFLLFLSISVIVFVFAGMVVLVSSFDFSHYVNRGTALPYDKEGVLFGAFSPRALLSVVFSYPASISDTSFWGADFSMVNTFFGFFSLLVLVFFLLSGKIPVNSVYYASIAVLFLMIAMAEVFPFRRWLYLCLPYMDLFRFSSLFRLFAIFFFILAAGFCIEKLMVRLRYGRPFIRFMLISGILLFIFLVIMFFNIERWMFKTLVTDGFLYFDGIAGIGEKVFFQGSVFLGLMCICLILIWKKREWGGRILLLAVFTEMIISVQLNINATVVYACEPRQIERHLDKLTADFPVPSLNHSMKASNDNTMGKNMPYLWRNLGELYKIPSSSSFSPYKLNTIQKAVRNKTLDAVIDRPMVFLAESLNEPGVVDTSTILQTNPEMVQITEFNPGIIKIETNADTALYLVLLQNQYPYWNVTIDDAGQEIIPVNDAFMAVRLQKGAHHVVFRFRSQKIICVFWISFICWVLCLSIIIFSWLKQPGSGLNLYLRVVILIMTFIILIILFINNRQRYFHSKKMITAMADFSSCSGNDSVKFVLNIDNPAEFPADLVLRSSLLRLQQRNDLSELQGCLIREDSEYILFAQVNTPFMPETEWLISRYYPKEIMLKEFGNNYFTLRKKGDIKDEIVSFSSVNDFEVPVPGWSDAGRGLDSMVSCSGRYCNRLDSVNIYSSTYTTAISGIPEPAGKYFRISLMARKETGGDALIVFDVSRKDKPYIWNAVTVNDMVAENGQWSQICMFKYPYERLKKDDVLKIYVWNNSKGDGWIDDFRIELIQGDGH